MEQDVGKADRHNSLSEISLVSELLRAGPSATSEGRWTISDGVRQLGQTFLDVLIESISNPALLKSFVISECGDSGALTISGTVVVWRILHANRICESTTAVQVCDQIKNTICIALLDECEFN